MCFSPTSQPLPSGTGHLIAPPQQIELNGNLRYFVWVSPDAEPGDPVLVSVHGISRNADAHARLFSRAGFSRLVIVAPLFDEQNFPRYQRVGKRAARADRALDRILADVERRTVADASKVRLFGYSGGAQFAHRYAMLNPGRIDALGLASAGWYTSLDSGLPFPQGLGAVSALPDPAARIDEFLELPIRVVVGDRDGQRDASLNQSNCIDVNQGATRTERAARWVGSLRTAALARGKVADVTLEFLPGGEHCFEQNVRVAGLMDWIRRYLCM